MRKICDKNRYKTVQNNCIKKYIYNIKSYIKNNFIKCLKQFYLIFYENSYIYIYLINCQCIAFFILHTFALNAVRVCDMLRNRWHCPTVAFLLISIEPWLIFYCLHSLSLQLPKVQWTRWVVSSVVASVDHRRDGNMSQAAMCPRLLPRQRHRR